jgi:hypothetical protein
MDSLKALVSKVYEYLKARPKLHFLAVVGVLVVPLVVGVAFFGVIESYTTGTPQFCMSCHARQGNIDFLASSTRHPKKVTCPECHADHTVLVPRDFKADDARVNANCRRCHQSVLEKEPEYGNNPLKIIMNHQFHLEGVGAQCTDCHRNVSHDKFEPVTNRPRMDFCFQCHEVNRETCSKCHTKGYLNPPKQAKARRSVCSKCHPTFEDKKISIYDIEFSHRRHLAKAIDCNKCHSNVEKHGTIIRARSECIGCHHSLPETGCNQCHDSQRSLYSGRLGRFGFDRAQPNSMYGKVDCSGCHDTSKPHSIVSVSSRCVGCHGDAYTEVLTLQKSGVDEQLKAVLLAIKKLEKQIAGVRKRGKGLKEAESLIARAKERVEFIRKVKGIHNSSLATEVLKQAERQIGRARNLLRSL